MKNVHAISIRAGLCCFAVAAALALLTACQSNAVESTSASTAHPTTSWSAFSTEQHAHNHAHSADHPDHSEHGDDHHHAHAQQTPHHDHHHPASDASAPCICPASGNAASSTQSEIGIWCRKCNVGHLAGIKIESAMLFETLDPHGHDIDVNTLHCQHCIAAVAVDGFCQSCGIGFKGKQAYFTPLTWGLARGAAMRDHSCQACASLTGNAGWCERCSRGIVGNIQIDDREIYEPTATELHVLRSAIARVSACELCACAMVVHRTCPNCRISYATQSHHHH